MLSKVFCSLFRADPIVFHDGLNVILGDDDAKNSIGKSSALMVIDFVMAGDSLLRDKAGVISKLGHHVYTFEFIFLGATYTFSRSTSSPGVVVCLGNVNGIDTEMSIEEYRARLKHLYGLDSLQHSFRSIVSPFIRIWEKGQLEPDKPFAGDSSEPASASMGRLIDLFGRSEEVDEERAILAEHQVKKRLISKSMNLEIIPRINKTQYKANQKVISTNSRALDEFKQGVAGALTAYEALFDSEIRGLHDAKATMVVERNALSAKIDRIRQDIVGVTPKLSANVSLVTEFFPDVDVARLQKVEEFHKGIGRILKKELGKELASCIEARVTLDGEIAVVDEKIRSRLAQKGTPDDLFDKAFELKESSDKAINENQFYERKLAVINDVRISKERLDAAYVNIFLDIESALNRKLRQFNNVVYGAERSPSALRIKSEASYVFFSPKDSGTGKSYAGLVGFDLAMLSLTRLPFVIHDSVIYKNIEVPATRNIIRILGALKKKQVFLAFDEAKKFGARAEQILRSNAVVKLSDKELFFNSDWRKK